MSHETSQVAIQDRPLLSIDAQPRVGQWTEIGEAEVTQTIFGKAKVRIIRKHGQTRRRAWLLTALAAMTIGIAAWQSWLASERLEPQQTADLHPPVSAQAQVIAPAPQPETVAPPAAPPSEESKPVTPPPAEIGKPPISKRSALPQSEVLQGDEPVATKLAKERSSKASKPQATPLAADNSGPMNQTDKPLSPKVSAPKQPSMAAAVAMPSATKQVAQPAASSPAAVVPLAGSMVKGDTSTQSPAGGQPPPVSVNSQSK